GREQLIARGGVLRDRVVVHVDMHVVAVLLLLAGRESRDVLAGLRIRVGSTDREGAGEFALTDVDAARERAGIVRDPVVGDLEEMAPAVHEQATAALRSILDRQSVDAGGIAVEVTRV